MHQRFERHVVFRLAAVQHPVQGAGRVDLVQRLAHRLVHRQLQHLLCRRVQVDDALVFVNGHYALFQRVPDIRPLHHQPVQVLGLVARQLAFDVAGQPPGPEAADAQRHRRDDQVLQHGPGHHPVHRPHVDPHHGIAQQVALPVKDLGAGAALHAVFGLALLQKDRLGPARVRLDHALQAAAGAGPGQHGALRVDDHRHVQIAHPANNLLQQCGDRLVAASLQQAPHILGAGQQIGHVQHVPVHHLVAGAKIQPQAAAHGNDHREHDHHHAQGDQLGIQSLFQACKPFHRRFPPRVFPAGRTWGARCFGF